MSETRILYCTGAMDVVDPNGDYTLLGVSCVGGVSVQSISVAAFCGVEDCSSVNSNLINAESYAYLSMTAVLFFVLAHGIRIVAGMFRQVE